MPTRTIPLDEPLDLTRTVAVHRRGPGDPTMRLVPNGVLRATRTPAGPATIEVHRTGDRILAEAWGPGADVALETLPAWIGLDDDRTGFVPDHHPLVRELARRHRAIRIGRSGAVLEALVPAVLEQKVTGTEAWGGFRALVLRYGEPAPGPHGTGPRGLRLQPLPATYAAIPYHAFHPLGVERRRADLVRRVAAHAARLEETVTMAREAAEARLRAVPGIGPWTTAEVLLRARGDVDAVSVGDFHLPHLVAFALAGEIRGTDARMLELLEPWRGHRARVIRLLELSGVRPPAFGPRYAPRSIAAI